MEPTDYIKGRYCAFLYYNQGLLEEVPKECQVLIKRAADFWKMLYQVEPSQASKIYLGLRLRTSLDTIEMVGSLVRNKK